MLEFIFSPSKVYSADPLLSADNVSIAVMMIIIFFLELVLQVGI